MAALKGYASFSGGDKGQEIALPICTGCQHFEYNEGGSHPYACTSGWSNSAARRLVDGRVPTSCPAYAPSGGDGKGKKGFFGSLFG